MVDPSWRDKRRKEHVTYQSAHWRAKALWAAASQYPCVKCGMPARDWAYDNTDPTEVRNDAGQRYSLWPEFYMPLCLPCHRAHDRPYRNPSRTWGTAMYHEDILQVFADFIANG